MEEDIEYIAKRYDHGRFSVNNGWKRLDITSTAKWRPMKIVAAIVSVVVLTATASLIYHQYSVNAEQEQVITPNTGSNNSEELIRVIDFENAPLPNVIERIKEVYGVDVVNIPENAEGYNLSLHYEGNADDLLATINEILGTEMAVNE
jgi:hypothetical protein